MIANLVIAALLQGALPPVPSWCDPFLIFFEPGSASVPPRQQQVIDNIVRVREQVRSHLEVVGHADASGSIAHNLRLSRRRAEAVRAALVAKGFERRQIMVRAAGESRPLLEVKKGSPEAQNRRVEVCFY